MSAIHKDRLHSALPRLSVNLKHQIYGLWLNVDAPGVCFAHAPDWESRAKVVLLDQSISMKRHKPVSLRMKAASKFF